MLTKRSFSTLTGTMLIFALLLGACQAQPAIPPSPSPLPPTPLPQKPTNTPAPAASVDCGSDLHASSVAEIAGEWAGLSGLPGKADIEFQPDGSYAILLVEPNASAGVPAGFVVDNGKFRFDGAQIKFENASCQDQKGNLFACVGIYEACVISQGSQTAQLRMVVIEDKFSGRRIGLTPKKLLTYVQP